MQKNNHYTTRNYRYEKTKLKAIFDNTFIHGLGKHTYRRILEMELEDAEEFCAYLKILEKKITAKAGI